VIILLAATARQRPRENASIHRQSQLPSGAGKSIIFAVGFFFSRKKL
jgi:hypothetical protein